jgi:hypothetical protein
MFFVTAKSENCYLAIWRNIILVLNTNNFLQIYLQSVVKHTGTTLAQISVIWNDIGPCKGNGTEQSLE